jgi:glutamate-5-semialdehyde dehydrogenase
MVQQLIMGLSLKQFLMIKSNNSTNISAINFAKQAFLAKKNIANLSTQLKNEILLQVSQEIINNSSHILQANNLDLENAKQNNLEPSKIDRLILTEKTLNNISQSIVEIANLPDPVDKISYNTSRNNGLNIKRISVPIGVLLVVYESRPNVTSDVSALAIKSGNVAMLRCGSDSYQSSKVIADIYKKVLQNFNLDSNIISFCYNNERNFLQQLLQLPQYIDVIIPRGGKSLISAIADNTKIPLFKHLDGNCHTYVHADANFDKAIKIILNAKLRRTGICGATESLLVDHVIASQFVPLLCQHLQEKQCEIRGDDLSCNLSPYILPATTQDYYQEYLDKIVSLKIVENLNMAIDWINTHSSSHTESIITENSQVASQFLQQIDSAIVMHNASTQFADGGEFGLGAEVGIATGKLHARGPVGLEQLTTYKYLVFADCGLRD